MKRSLPIACLTLLITVMNPAGCASPTDPGSPLETTLEAYRAYARGDCATVEAIFDGSDVRGWPATEIRSSFSLLAGLCAEQLDEKQAQDVYRRLLRESPLSFAADDARDRLRVLRLRADDPDYDAWVEAARDRAIQGSTDRAPIHRPAALYPPLARIAEVGGFAVVEFGVTPRGDTDSPVVVDSDPPLLFDGVAIRAIREWRYAADTNGAQSERQAIRLVFRPEEAEVPSDLEPSSEPPASE